MQLSITNVSSQINSPTPVLDAQLLLCFLLNIDKTQLFSQPYINLSTLQKNKLQSLITRRNNDEPIAYIIGQIEFYGIKLTIDQRVLCPRPETETLVERAVKVIGKDLSVIDVGTGSGAIAAAIKTARPDLEVIAADISSQALELAVINFSRFRLDIDVVESDLLNQIAATDVIVANLPYLPNTKPLDSSVKHEPKQALLSGSDGLDHYRKLFKQLSNRTKTNQVFIEAEPVQKSELIMIANGAGYKLNWCKNYSYQFSR